MIALLFYFVFLFFTCLSLLRCITELVFLTDNRLWYIHNMVSFGFFLCYQLWSGHLENSPNDGVKCSGGSWFLIFGMQIGIVGDEPATSSAPWECSAIHTKLGGLERHHYWIWSNNCPMAVTLLKQKCPYTLIIHLVSKENVFCMDVTLKYKIRYTT